jgi:hypothetical protein
MIATVDESTFTDPASSGTTFRHDPTAQQYIYNGGTVRRIFMKMIQ